MEKQSMKIEDEEKKIAPISKTGQLSSSKSESIINSSKAEDSNQLMKRNDDSSSPSSSTKTPVNPLKAKSCKGCLYYSSHFKSDARNPLCVGLTRSLPNVPQHLVGQSESEASKEGRSLTDFRYACVGYSLYMDRKQQASNGKETHTELPVCVGLEVLVDRRHTVDSASAPSHIHNREDGKGLPHRPSPKPSNSVGEEFLSRFSRNANLVAKGVVKNVRRVGNQIKQSIDDILYPYRRPPK